MTHEVFISYSSKDQKIVEGLSAYLEQHGIRCFVAYRDIPSGQPWANHIPPAIKNCKLMVYIHSDNANKSTEIDKEIALCLKYNHSIIPFRIKDLTYSDAKDYHLLNIHHIDAFPDPEKHFGKLYKEIRNMLHGKQLPPDNDNFASTKKGGNIFLTRKHAPWIIACLFALSIGIYSWISTNTKITNQTEAIIPFERLAKQGNAEAQYKLGCYYLDTKDYEKAFEWVLKSAEQGYGSAQFVVAQFFEIGIGCSKNIPEAILWYDKAAKRGDKKAQEKLKILQ